MEALALRPAPTLGSPTRLADVLYALRVTRRRLAADLGVCERTVRHWCDGDRLPPGPVAARLDVWLTARGHSLSAALEPAMADDPIPFPRAHAPSPTSDPEDPDMEISTLEYLTPEAMEHFGLTADPFDAPDNPEDIWRSPAIKRIEMMLVTAMRRRQIAAVVGEPGSGKSTLIRRIHGLALKNEKHVRLVAVASLDRRKVTSAALSVALIRDLIEKDTSSWSMEARSELLRRTLEDQNRNGIVPALLIDEAHLLPPAALIAIKQVWDSHIHFQQLAVILVGQLLLKSRLRTDTTLKELTGRTALVELPKVIADAGDYLRWRFARVGANADEVFDATAFRALGIRAEYPLWINNLAVRAMHVAQSVGDTLVTASHVAGA